MTVHDTHKLMIHEHDHNFYCTFKTVRSPDVNHIMHYANLEGTHREAGFGPRIFSSQSCAIIYGMNRHCPKLTTETG